MPFSPKPPPLDDLRRRVRDERAGARGRGVTDGFLRETFSLPRLDARVKAQEWFQRWPKQAYWTTIEAWREKPDDVIEFTIRRLPAAD